MAEICSLSPPLMIQKSVQINFKRSVNKVLMVMQSQISVKKTPQLLSRSFSRNKIFEDQSKGIVCYRDDSGEITCEGYDEGPRLHPQLSTRSYHPSEYRDAEIVDLLQKNWLQIRKGGDL